MYDLFGIPCIVYRGGTSRGLFFHEKDLPERKFWDDIFLTAMGSPDKREIDGLGGATSHTSKIVVISKKDEYINYLFAQVGIDEAVVDYKGMCGNLLSAVGPFAVDESLIEAEEPKTSVKVLNVNTGKRFEVAVPVKNGKSVTQGDYSIAGVQKSGAKIDIKYIEPAGAKTGKLFPTGRRKETLNTKKPIDISILDVSNPMVFIRAKDVDIDLRTWDKKSSIDKLNEIRDYVACILGFAENLKEASLKSAAIPKIALVQSSKDENADIISFMLSMGRVHESYAATGAVCIGAASKIPGTVVYEIAQKNGDKLNILHPSGIMDVEVEIEFNKEINIKSISMGRTARRLMDGEVYVPDTVFK
ncbi:MAG: PrpF domain-containing protein [Campylobacterota bacterium]|nr:PrpF domain-containing protein [Campylobacterota bacterium]